MLHINLSSVAPQPSVKLSLFSWNIRIFFVKKWSNLFLHLYLMAKGKRHLAKFSVLDGCVSFCWCWLGNWVRCVGSRIRSTRPSQALGTQKTLCNSSPTDCPTSWRSSYWILMITVFMIFRNKLVCFVTKSRMKQLWQWSFLPDIKEHCQSLAPWSDRDATPVNLIWWNEQICMPPIADLYLFLQILFHNWSGTT